MMFRPLSLVLAMVVLAAVSAPAISPSPAGRDAVLGAWLPHGEDLFEPWRRHQAATARLDGNEMFAMPARVTRFVSPDRTHGVSVVYDPVARVALSSRGCCAWQETVLATVAASPPAPVVRANLNAVHTRRGIKLGDGSRAVMRAYGHAAMHRSTTHPELRVLSYYRDQHVRGSSCGWFENFVFRDGRLILIQAGHGC